MDREVIHLDRYARKNNAEGEPKVSDGQGQQKTPPPPVVACASLSGAPCDIQGNMEAILAAMESAQQEGADVLVLPRLCLVGATSGDMLCNRLLLDKAWQALERIALRSGSVLTCIGLPVLMEGQCREVCALVQKGAIQQLLPYQFPLQPLAGGDLSGKHRGIPLNAFLGVSVQGYLMELYEPGKLTLINLDDTPTLLIQPAAAPYFAGSDDVFLSKVIGVSKQENTLLAVAEAGAMESTTDGVYGGRCAMANKGRLVGFTPAFAKSPFIKAKANARGRTYAPAPRPQDVRTPWGAEKDDLFFMDCLDIVSHALAARLARTGIKHMVLGLSGGLDSAMALVTMEEARRLLNLPPSSLHAYALPGPGSSEGTLHNARALCAALDIPLKEISITEAVQQHLMAIGHGGQHDAAYENAQARERTQILMDICNMVNGLMIGPGDMSELALGFTTYGGDHISMYGVNAGLPKTLIRQTLRWYSRTNPGALGDALDAILDTPVSPELLPGGKDRQKTEDILGPYALTDFYLWHFLKEGLSPRELYQKAAAAFFGQYQRDTLLNSLQGFFRRFFAAQFKRSCLPDGPQVLPISLSPRGGLSLPSDAASKLWLEDITQLMKEELP